MDLGKYSGFLGHLARVKKQRVDNHTPFIQSFTMFFFCGGLLTTVYTRNTRKGMYCYGV